MIITINNKKAKVYWKHYMPDSNLENIAKTVCFIEPLSLKNCAGFTLTGTAQLSKKDSYNKKIGRKISFERALKVQLPKEKRTLIWNEIKNTNQLNILV
jgi:hypothetical protein